ncbi:hypothetical protein GXW82_08620 [Streptacidiphilus sp. 4-A2]|nr:hypothetical protein [Streptacidiphilus sp. 4-A2]
MNGPGPIPPKRRSTAVRATVILLRVVLAAVPLVTVGILGWVPLVWLAATRRRTRDWVMLCLTAFLCTAMLILCGATDSYTNWESNIGGGGLMLMAVFCSVYFLVNDLRRAQRKPPATLLGPALAPAPALGLGPDGRPYPQPYPPRPTGYRPAPAPAAPPVPAPSGRIDQVRAELDELSAYLREQGHDREREWR